MSRIGLLPIVIPEGVTVNVDENNLVSVKGPKGELSQQVDKAITVKVENQQIVFERPDEEIAISAGVPLFMTVGQSTFVF
jgi:large subunit ribosomal protein L6